MPTYQYACTECGAQTEIVQRFSDDPLTTCTECQGRLRKVYSAVGVVFKGSGFYKTDSRSGSNGSSTASGNGTSSASSGETSSTSSESTGTDSGGTSSESSASSGSGSNDSTSSGSTDTKVA